MSNRRKPTGSPSDPENRRAEAEALIDKILHGTPEGRVDPAISENLRHHLAKHPGQPDRALLAHFKDQIPGMEDAVFPEDLQ
jgi:hypothetical protein